MELLEKQKAEREAKKRADEEAAAAKQAADLEAKRKRDEEAKAKQEADRLKRLKAAEESTTVEDFTKKQLRKVDKGAEAQKLLEEKRAAEEAEAAFKLKQEQEAAAILAEQQMAQRKKLKPKEKGAIGSLEQAELTEATAKVGVEEESTRGAEFDFLKKLGLEKGIKTQLETAETFDQRDVTDAKSKKAREEEEARQKATELEPTKRKREEKEGEILVDPSLNFARKELVIKRCMESDLFKKNSGFQLPYYSSRS